MNKKDIVINGEWDGEPIWRRRTAEEKLLALIYENDLSKSKSKSNTTASNPKVESSA